MTREYCLVCNLCGIFMKVNRYDDWWSSKDNMTHICPHCCDIVHKALAIDEFIVTSGAMLSDTTLVEIKDGKDD